MISWSDEPHRQRSTLDVWGRALLLVVVALVLALVAVERADAADAVLVSSQALGAATTIDTDFTLSEGVERFTLNESLSGGCVSATEMVTTAQVLYARPLNLGLVATAGRLRPIATSAATSLNAGVCYAAQTWATDGARHLTLRFTRVGTSARTLTVVLSSSGSMGDVTVSNFPATQPVSGSLSVANFPAVASSVALSEGDASRLDLIWIGIFLVGGISFGMALSSWIKREQSKWGMEA